MRACSSNCAIRALADRCLEIVSSSRICERSGGAFFVRSLSPTPAKPPRAISPKVPFVFAPAAARRRSMRRLNVGLSLRLGFGVGAGAVGVGAAGVGVGSSGDLKSVGDRPPSRFVSSRAGLVRVGPPFGVAVGAGGGVGLPFGASSLGLVSAGFLGSAGASSSRAGRVRIRGRPGVERTPRPANFLMDSGSSVGSAALGSALVSEVAGFLGSGSEAASGFSPLRT